MHRRICKRIFQTSKENIRTTYARALNRTNGEMGAPLHSSVEMNRRCRYQNKQFDCIMHVVLIFLHVRNDADVYTGIWHLMHATCEDFIYLEGYFASV